MNWYCFYKLEIKDELAIAKTRHVIQLYGISHTDRVGDELRSHDPKELYRMENVHFLLGRQSLQCIPYWEENSTSGIAVPESGNIHCRLTIQRLVNPYTAVSWPALNAYGAAWPDILAVLVHLLKQSDKRVCWLGHFVIFPPKVGLEMFHRVRRGFLQHKSNTLQVL